MCRRKFETRGLRQGGAEDQLFLLNMTGDDSGHATFNQVCDSLPIALSIAKKFDPELVIFVPAHDGDLDGQRKFCFRCLKVQCEVAAGSESHVALYSATCLRKIEEGSFCRAVVGLDIGRVPHVPSWAIP